MATLNGLNKVAQCLICQPQCDINALDQAEFSALTIASNQGNTDVVKYLLERPECHVNRITRHGFNALMIAAMRGEDEICKLLLARNDCLVNETNEYYDDTTPLMYAITSGNLEVIKILTNTGGHLNDRQCVFDATDTGTMHNFAKDLLPVPNVE